MDRVICSLLLQWFGLVDGRFLSSPKSIFWFAMVTQIPIGCAQHLRYDVYRLIKFASLFKAHYGNCRCSHLQHGWLIVWFLNPQSWQTECIFPLIDVTRSQPPHPLPSTWQCTMQLYMHKTEAFLHLFTATLHPPGCAATVKQMQHAGAAKCISKSRKSSRQQQDR